MATCWVSEWQGIREQGGGIQAPYGFIKTTALTIDTEAHTAAHDPACRLIEIGCDTACHFRSGKDAAATTSDMQIPADVHSKFISVNGGVDRFSVIATA
jgi:hypothetical protein